MGKEIRNLAVSLILAILLVLVLFPLDTNDIPKYSTDEVLIAAETYSPDCKYEQCG